MKSGIARIILVSSVPVGILVALGSGSWGLGVLSMLGGGVLAVVVDIIDVEYDNGKWNGDETL